MGEIRVLREMLRILLRDLELPRRYTLPPRVVSAGDRPDAQDFDAKCSRLWVANSMDYRAVPVWPKGGAGVGGVGLSPASGWGW